MYGYHGRILHVNLTNGQIHMETFDETFARTYSVAMAISLGVTLVFAFECYERGLLT